MSPKQNVITDLFNIYADITHRIKKCYEDFELKGKKWSIVGRYTTDRCAMVSSKTLTLDDNKSLINNISWETIL